MYVGYHDANNVSNFGGDPVTQLHLKDLLMKLASLLSTRCRHSYEEQQYGMPYQPKHSPNLGHITHTCMTMFEHL